MFKIKLKMQESPKGLTMKSSTAEILRTIQGESAYKIWLDAGNTGSVQDFLDSLQGKDYVPTEEDLQKIAQQAAEMVEVPELPEDTATEGWVKEYAQPKGSYVTEGQLQQAVEDAVKDLDIDVDLDGYATTEQLKQVADKIPDQLADLQEDSSHRTVTDTEKNSWNAKSNFSGSYDDLTNKPSIPQVPANVSAFNNDAGYQTAAQVQDYAQPKGDYLTEADKAEMVQAVLEALPAAEGVKF